jgi:hypothetical protein
MIPQLFSIIPILKIVIPGIVVERNKVIMVEHILINVPIPIV